jgi:hypothetical protein
MRPERKWTEDDARFKELVLYICEKCANDPRFGATKLNKILYFSDFLAFGESGAPITGMEYQKIKKGPAPRRMVPIRDEMVKAGDLAIQRVKLISGGRVQERPINLRSANLEMFTSTQIALVDSIIEALRDATAEEVSELSHRMVGYKVVDVGEIIPYETIFVSDEPMSEADIDRARELARQLA